MNRLESFYNVIVPHDLLNDEYVRIAAFHKDGAGNKVFFVRDYAEFVDIVEKYKYNWNMFITLSTTKGQNDGGTADSLSRRQVIFLDFDKKDYPQ